MLTDKTYFIGEINIAQLSSAPVEEALNLFIAKREPEYLEKALGIDFAELFATGIAEDRFVALRDGATYVNADGKKKKWLGFNNELKSSPIANYIYYWYIGDAITFTAGIGEMEGKSENAKKADPNMKLYRAWNEMVALTEVMHDFLQNKKDEDGEYVYPEFDIDQVECIDRITFNGI